MSGASDAESGQPGQSGESEVTPRATESGTRHLLGLDGRMRTGGDGTRVGGGGEMVQLPPIVLTFKNHTNTTLVGRMHVVGLVVNLLPKTALRLLVWSTHGKVVLIPGLVTKVEVLTMKPGLGVTTK